MTSPVKTPPANAVSNSTQPRQKVSGKSDKKRSSGSGEIEAVPVLVSLLGIFCFSMPTFFILMAGMLPSIIAYFVNDPRRPYRLNVIGCCNFAGVLPYLAMVWSRNGDLNYAFELLSDVFVWATMYLGALFGTIVYRVGPSLAVAIINARMDRERRKLEEYGQKMVDEWGPDVMPTAERGAVDNASSLSEDAEEPVAKTESTKRKKAV